MLSPSWSVLLTVVFVATGVYSFARWSRDVATPSAGRVTPSSAVYTISQTSELNHLVMSVAMIAMVWRPSGTVGTAVQIVIFAVFALVFLLVGVRARKGAARVGAAAYVGMNAAMIWMLAAMPLLMGASTVGAGGGHVGHAGHQEAAAAPMGAMVMETPGWVDGINVAAIVGMAGVAVWWLVRSIRTDSGRLHHCCHALMGVGMGLMLAVMH